MEEKTPQIAMQDLVRDSFPMHSRRRNSCVLGKKEPAAARQYVARGRLRGVCTLYPSVCGRVHGKRPTRPLRRARWSGLSPYFNPPEAESQSGGAASGTAAEMVWSPPDPGSHTLLFSPRLPSFQWPFALEPLCFSDSTDPGPQGNGSRPTQWHLHSAYAV